MAKSNGKKRLQKAIAKHEGLGRSLSRCFVRLSLGWQWRPPVAVFAGAVMIFISVEPEDASEYEVLFFDGVGRFPDTASGFASNKVSAGFGVVADFLADAVPAEGSFITVGFGACPFFCGGDGERAGDGAVVGNEVEFLSGDGNAEVRHLL